jgi:hypothetical protein
VTRIFLWLFLAVVWAVASLGVLLPLLGIAWVAARLTDLTMFQAVLFVTGANLLVAYVFTHSLTGSIPPFLRGTVIEDLMEEELEEEVNLRPPPRRPHRRRK